MNLLLTPEGLTLAGSILKANKLSGEMELKLRKCVTDHLHSLHTQNDTYRSSQQLTANEQYSPFHSTYPVGEAYSHALVMPEPQSPPPSSPPSSGSLLATPSLSPSLSSSLSSSFSQSTPPPSISKS